MVENSYRDTELAARYGIHRQSLWRWVSQGKFPSPVKLGGMSRWPESIVLEYERAQLTASIEASAQIKQKLIAESNKERQR